MAVVGEAHIVVRALTTKVAGDIKSGFDGIDGATAARAGKTMGDQLREGFNKSTKGNWAGKVADSLRNVAPGAEAARDSMNQLILSGYKMSTMASVIVSSIGTIIGGLGALIGAAGSAAPALMSLVNIMVSFRVGMAVAQMALGGVAQAVGAAAQNQRDYNKALEKARKELKQLKFDAEAAALAEEGAAISLEKAIENLNMTADLPPNSRARREAVLAYKEADLAYRRAQERNKDAQKQAGKTVDQLARQSQGDPFAGLNKSQKDFAKYLLTLKPIFDKLKSAVSKGFLPKLQEGIETLVKSKSFKVIETGIVRISKALGNAVRPIFEFLASKKGAELLSNAFTTIQNTITNLGPIIDKALQIFLKLMGSSNGVTQDFLFYIDNLLGKFIDLLDLVDSTGSLVEGGGGGLAEMFNIAGDTAGKFGQIIRGVFDGLIAIIQANFGPGTGGSMILDWLVDATKGFGDLSKDKDGLKKYFVDVADNFIKMFSGLGGLVGALAQLGADPNVGIFWETVKKATPALGEMIGKFMEILPIAGELLVSIVDIINALADSSAPKMFFSTLNDAIKVVVPILQSDLVQSVLKVTGQFHAFGLAAGKIFDVVNQVLGFTIGNVIKVFDTVGQGIEAFKKFGSIVSKIGPGLGKAFSFIGKNPMMILVIGIAAVVMGLMTLYNRNEKFRQQIDAIFGPALAALGKAFSAISTALQPVIGAFTILMERLFGGGGIDGNGEGPLVKFFIQFAQVVSALIVALAPLIAQLVAKLVPIITSLIQILIPIIDLVIKLAMAFMSVLAPIVAGVIVLVVSLVSAIVDLLMPILNGLINFLVPVIKFFSALIEVVISFFATLFSKDQDWEKFGNGLKGVGHSIVQSLADMFTGFVNLVVELLNGLLKLMMYHPIVSFLADAVSALSNGKIDIKAKVNAGLIPTAPRINVPQFADGGVVNPSSGGTLGLIAEAGRPERIEPLDENGLSKRDKALINTLSLTSGLTINIHGADMDKNELAEEVSRRIAFQMRRGAIA